MVIEPHLSLKVIALLLDISTVSIHQILDDIFDDRKKFQSIGWQNIDKQKDSMVSCFKLTQLFENNSPYSLNLIVMWWNMDKNESILERNKANPDFLTKIHVQLIFLIKIHLV